MKYFNESLDFNVYPVDEGYWGMGYDNFRKLLDGFMKMIFSELSKANLSRRETKVFGPVHCVLGETEKQIIIGISTDSALRKGTILTLLKKTDEYKSKPEVEKLLEETCRTEIGYIGNTFFSIDKSILHSELTQKALESDQDFLNAIAAVINEIDAEYQKDNSVKNHELEILSEQYWHSFKKSVDEFVDNRMKEMHEMNFDPIFKARDLTVDENLVFVALPFTEDRLEILDEVIKPALEEDRGLSVLRSGNMFEAGMDIMENIWTYINKARIVIVDISDKNPNVFYELGICNTIGKPVITICDEESYANDYSGKLPFDIMGKNVIFYQNHGNGMRRLVTTIEKTVDSVLTGKPILDTSN